ncbi:MAG: hypothetical protein AAB787_01600 [Patescibacteria group bacterium]
MNLAIRVDQRKTRTIDEVVDRMELGCGLELAPMVRGVVAVDRVNGVGVQKMRIDRTRGWSRRNLRDFGC